jgi:hypothetical protein
MVCREDDRGVPGQSKRKYSSSPLCTAFLARVFITFVVQVQLWASLPPLRFDLRRLNCAPCWVCARTAKGLNASCHDAAYPPQRDGVEVFSFDRNESASLVSRSVHAHVTRKRSLGESCQVSTRVSRHLQAGQEFVDATLSPVAVARTESTVWKATLWPGLQYSRRSLDEFLEEDI